MDPQALLLARLQFAFTISFHIIFPAFSIGSWAILLGKLHTTEFATTDPAPTRNP